MCLNVSKFEGISTAGEDVNVKIEAPGISSIQVFMTAFLMKILAGVCPSEKWGASSCSLVLHWHWPNFVLTQPVSTKDGATVIVRRDFHSVRALVQLAWAKHMQSAV